MIGCFTYYKNNAIVTIYEGIEIEVDDIKELYLVKGIIKKIQI